MESDQDGEERSIGWRLYRHGMAFSRAHAARARAAGLDTTKAVALAHLLHAGELTASELGRRLLLGPAELLAQVEALEHDGFLSRRPAPFARGVDLLRATTLASRALGSRAAESGDALTDHLDPGARAAIGDFLTRVVATTERDTDERGEQAGPAAEPPS
jgi:DNA-binding MarR family transcriptional regulator